MEIAPRTIAILGAGEVGATIARQLADRDVPARVVLVDGDVGKARGKALDIVQAGPVEASDTRIEGCASLADVGPADVVIAADTPELDPHETASHRLADFMRSLVPAVGKGLLLVARADASVVVEMAVAKGQARSRALGSLPVALAAALRRRLATELHVEPREVAGVVLGRPPHDLVLPRESATIGGVPIDRLSAVACRRALESLRARVLGPVALAAAAVRVLDAAGGTRATILPVVAVLEGEYGHRGVALAVPARLRAGALEAVIEIPLDPVDRVAFDGAAQRGQWSRGA